MRTVVLATFVVCLAAITAEAQNLVTGSIAGSVTDETGSSLPGVSVTLTSPALQVGQRETVTDAEGRYGFLDLPVGDYRLVYTMAGFRSLVRDDVRLTTGFAARINVELPIGALEETVTVSGQSPVVDITTTRGGQTIATDVVNSTLPMSRNYVDVVRLTPGLVVTTLDATRPGQVGLPAVTRFDGYGFSGGNDNITLTIDGMDMHVQTSPDFGMTQEIDVKSFGNSAEVMTPGASITMVSKSGGNTFHGRYTEMFMGDALQAENLDDRLRAQGLTIAETLKYFNDVSGDLGGRIVRDKLWFFGSFRDRRNERGVAGFVLNAGPDGRYLTGDEPPAFPTATQWNGAAKVTYQMTSKHQVSGYWQREDIWETGNTRSVPFGTASARIVTWEASSNQTWIPAQYKGDIRSTLSNRLLFDAQFGRSDYRISYYPQIGSEALTPAWDRETQLYTGASIGTGTQSPRRSHQPFLQSSGNLTYHAGDLGGGGSHLLKVGYRLKLKTDRNGRANNPSGNYILVFDRVGGVAHQPVEMATFNFPVTPQDHHYVSSAYLTDRWEISNRLTLNLGLRFDRQVSFVPEQTKEQGQFGNAGTYPRREVGTWHQFAPRAAAAWDVTGTGTTVAKATYGRFNQETNLAGQYNLNTQTLTQYRWRDLNRNSDYDVGEVNLDLNGPDFISTTSTANNRLNPDLRIPYAHEITASLEREALPNMSVRGLFLYRVNKDDFSNVNVLRPYSAFTIPLQRRDPGPDGIINTADDGGFVTIYDYAPQFRGAAFVGNMPTNRPKGREDSSRTFEVSLNRRTVNRWGVTTSFSATKAHRWLSPIATSPNDDAFAIDETWRWSFKFTGSYRLPYDVQFGVLYDLARGQPGQRTYVFRAADPLGGPPLVQQTTVNLRMEPYGTRRGPAVGQLDFRAGKVFQMPKGQFQANVDFINATNANTAFATTWVSGPTFGNVTSYQSARTVRLGVIYSF